MEKCKGAFNSFILKYSRLSIIMVYNLVIMGVGGIFYHILPELMGYPPEAQNVSRALGTNYFMQYAVIITGAIAIGSLVLSVALRKIGRWQELLGYSMENPELLSDIRKKCINIPYLIYIFQIVFVNIPVFIVIAIINVVNRTPVINSFRVLYVCFAFLSLVAIISHIFSKRIFQQILYKTFTGEATAEGIRINLRTKFFLQIIPIFIVVTLFTGLAGYSRLIEEKGDMVYMVCKGLLQRAEELGAKNSPQDIFESFLLPDFPKGVVISYFLITSEGEFVSSDGYRPSAFFSYYVEHPVGAKKDRVYGDTNEIQAVVRQVDGAMGSIKVGIRYQLASHNTIVFFIGMLLSILLLCIIVLYYFSKAFSEEISVVAKSLSEIAAGENMNLNKKIPVTSNDEIGDLVIAYNKIRDREYEYDRMKNEFITNVSHELRTPLNIILAATQLSEAYMNGSENEYIEKSGKNIKTVKQNSLRLLRLVNNLIDINKVEAGYLKPHIVQMDMVRLIEDIISSVGQYSKAKNVSIHFDADVESKTMYCDPNLIERIILNLISNAIKFTNPGGSVFVRIADRDTRVMISVRDTGIGIPKDKQKYIFERYRQVHKTIAQTYEGSGIGLSLVKFLVEVLEGEIGFSSTEGAGSEFVVLLPVKEWVADEDETENIHDRILDSDVMRRINIELSDLNL